MTRALRLPMLSVFVSTLLILTASNLPAQPPTRGSITAWGSEAWWQVPEEGTWLIADVPAGRNFVKCAGGYWRYAALRADGTLAAWGQNNILQVPAGNDFIDVCVAQWGAAALRQDGSVIQWGGNTVFPEEIPPGPFCRSCSGSRFPCRVEGGWFPLDGGRS